MSKTSYSAIDELYAYKLVHGTITKEDIPKFRQKAVLKCAEELSTELKSDDKS